MTIEITPLASDQITKLEKYLAIGASGKHQERLSQQENGEITYLIAWLDNEAVGHVVIRWDGSREAPVAAALDKHPSMEDLLVAPAFRGKGVAKELIKAAEEQAVSKGYREIGLIVGVANQGAHFLYTKQGYQDSGIGAYMTRASYRDSNNIVHWQEEKSYYLIKTLKKA